MLEIFFIQFFFSILCNIRYEERIKRKDALSLYFFFFRKYFKIYSSVYIYRHNIVTSRLFFLLSCCFYIFIFTLRLLQFLTSLRMSVYMLLLCYFISSVWSRRARLSEIDCVHTMNINFYYFWWFILFS